MRARRGAGGGGGGRGGRGALTRRTPVIPNKILGASKDSTSADSTLAFAALVFLGVTTQVAFKLSQRNGQYEYNTMSAMTIVECVKLGMSLFQYNQNGKGFDAARREFQNIPRIVFQSYFYLAFSYAVYNQLVFVAMRVAEPGTFSIIKSFTPAIVSALNFFMFGESLTKNQWLCVLIQIFGIIPVIASSDSASDNTTGLSYEPKSMSIIFFTIALASVNTVYNAKVIKELTLPIAVQNIVLYMFGVATNLAGYAWFRWTGDKNNNQQSFFNGYDNPSVILLLFLNSFVGIAITIIYKYGGAVLKTLSSPFSSAILVYISYLFFDMPLDIVKAAGAAVVIIDTLLYLSLEPASKNSGNPMSHNDSKWLNILLFMFSLSGLYVLDFEYLFAPSSTKLRPAEKLPIALIIQALKLEKNATKEALLINKQKLRVFESYRPYFQDVIFDSPLYVGDQGLADACNDVAFEDIDAHCWRCNYTVPLNKWGFDQHRFACAGSIMTTLKAKPDLYSGVLVIHADFYLLPAFLEMASEYLTNYQGSYWLLGENEKHKRKARPVFKNDTLPKKSGWHWHDHWMRVEAFRADLARKIGLEGNIAVPNYNDIIAWADLYFTPKEYWDDFIPLSLLSMKHKMMNEIAVPLIHQLIAEMNNFKGVAQINAMGGTSGTPLQGHLNSTEKLITHPCGHKLDLTSSVERNRLIEVWQNRPDFMPPSIERNSLIEVWQNDSDFEQLAIPQGSNWLIGAKRIIEELEVP